MTGRGGRYLGVGTNSLDRSNILRLLKGDRSASSYVAKVFRI